MVENTTQQEIPSLPDSTLRSVSNYKSNGLKIAVIAVMTALVAVTTLYLQIPIATTGGYFNVGEVMIYVTAFLFGPYVGAIAGGLGAAFSDLMFPAYAIFAPATLIGKGLEGFVIGYIYRKIKEQRTLKVRIVTQIISILIGGSIMVFTYFIFEYFFLQQGPSAFVEIPLNYLQVFLGMIIAIPLAQTLENQTNLTQFQI